MEYSARSRGKEGVGQDSVHPDTALRVGTNIDVSEAHPDWNHWEAYLATDPHNPERMLVCSTVVPSDLRRLKVTMVTYASLDGGTHWHASSLNPGHYMSDPICAYGPDGSAYVLTFVAPFNGDEQTDYNYLYHSTDGGVSWHAPLQYRGTADEEYVTVDSTDGPFGDTVYMTENVSYESSD
jgi:hypothetical protein